MIGISHLLFEFLKESVKEIIEYKIEGIIGIRVDSGYSDPDTDYCDIVFLNGKKVSLSKNKMTDKFIYTNYDDLAPRYFSKIEIINKLQAIGMSHSNRIKDGKGMVS